MNVYTRELKPTKLRPVMAYIHGGAFYRGSSSPEIYSADFLLQKDIVLCIFNYRFGVFGFLSFDDPSIGIPGNAGLKDQMMALKWIKENVESFGGDPNNITLFGESAGGASVHLHMLSDKSDGLFHKAIIMSGCALNYWAIVQPRNWGERLAKTVGWNGEGGQKGAFDVLCNTPAYTLVEQQSLIVTLDEKKDFYLGAFSPVVEPYATEQCMISKHPYELLANAWSNRIPIVIGGTRDEGLFFMVHDQKAHLDAIYFKTMGNCVQYVPHELGLNFEDERRKKFGLLLKNYYYPNDNPSLDNVEPFVKVRILNFFLYYVTYYNLLILKL